MCSETGGIGRFYDSSVESAVEPRATGRCLCGAVTYEVRGLLRDVVLCHCVECRRWSGTGAGAFAAAYDDDLIVDGDALQWVDSPDSRRKARRGFCAACGTSLFWKAPELERTGIAAGTLDEPTGLTLAAHIYTHQVVDWDELAEDGLPRDPEAGAIEVRWT